MAKYSVGQYLVSASGRSPVSKVVGVSLDLYLLRVVSSKNLPTGFLRGAPKDIVESKTKPLIVEDNV